MLRQYHPQRFRYSEIGTPRMRRLMAVGTIPVGTIFTSRSIERGVTRTLMVEAWLPREIGAGAKVDGRWVPRYVANAGHLAVCRDLSNGRQVKLADHFVRFAVDHD